MQMINTGTTSKLLLAQLSTAPNTVADCDLSLHALARFLKDAAALTIANRTSQPSTGWHLPQAISQLETFLRDAAALRSPALDVCAHLQDFLREAGPIVVNPVLRRWDEISMELTTLRRWRVEHDLLGTIAHLEDSYTELVAWALHPQTDCASAEMRQRSWLNTLSIDWRDSTPAIPVTQLLTSDGIPDLVLSYQRQTVVVEVKKWSDEHETPSGMSQTLAYPAAVRKTLALGADHDIYMVFLTPMGCSAANPDAVTSSFCQFAVGIAKGLVGANISPELRIAFGMLITHLATFGCDAVKQALAWPDEPSGNFLLDHLQTIAEITRLLRRDNVQRV